MKKAAVMATCEKDWVPVKDVTFLNVEEGPQGEDVLTYKCPLCGEEHKSVVVMR